MLKRYRSFLLLCLSGLLGMPLISSAETLKDEKEHGSIVARVGEIPLSKFDLSLKFQKTLPSQVGYHGKIDEEKIAGIRSQVFQELIDEARQVNWAREQKISISNDSMEEAMRPLIDKYQTVEALKKKIGEDLYSDLRAFLYREQLAKKAQKVSIDEKVTISEKDVQEYYEVNKEKFFRPDQYRVSHILIKVHPAATTEERQELRLKAENLLASARAGEDFYNLAYYNSDDRTKFVGGDMGYFHSGRVLREFEEAVKTMNPGDISDIVETRFGYHILKLTEHNPPRQLEFNEMREKLTAQLREEQKKSLRDAWMTRLEAGYPVEQFLSLEEAFQEEDAG